MARIGRIQTLLGDFDNASVSLKESKEILVKAYGENSPQAAQVYMELGRLFIYQRNFKDAFPQINKALEIAQSKYSSSQLLSDCYRTMGDYYFNIRNLDLALENYKKSQSILIEKYGMNHPDIGILLLAMGTINHHAGRIQDAFSFFEKAVEVIKNTSSENNPTLGGVYSNMALILMNQRKIKEAIETLQKALFIFNNKYGEENPHSAETLNNLGRLYLQSGNLNEAEKCIDLSIKYFTYLYGENDFSYAKALTTRGALLFSKNDYKGAYECYTKIAKVYEQTYGPHHPETQNIMKNLEFIKQKL